MLITRIQGQGVMGLPPFDHRLPERGILCVTGRNGKGKTTSFIEAPAWAAWKKTCRGTPLHTNATTVTLTTSELSVTRYTKGRDHGVTWSWLDRKRAVDYETSTKATAELMAALGEFETWQRSSVFSSADATYFTTSTDVERKQLIERLLAIDVFDESAKALKRMADEVSTNLTLAQSEASQLAATVSQIRETVSLLSKLTPPPPEFIFETTQRLNAALEKRAQLSATLQESTQRLGQARGELTAVERQCASHINGVCYACHQPIPASVLDMQRQQVESARSAFQVLDTELSSNILATRQELAQTNAAINALQESLPKQTDTEAITERLKALRAQGRELVAKLVSAQLEVDIAQEAFARVEYARRVMGPRGVRSRRLSRALTHVTRLANTYLAWLFDYPVTIRLESAKASTKNEALEKLVMHVEGLGGGHGYRACSGGERRRLDLAVLLALANLSPRRGTLFFDEAFDNLDRDGVSAAVELLRKTSEDRPIVVISHNAELIYQLGGEPVEL